MSKPVPTNAVNIPPINPVRKNTPTFHKHQSGTLRLVLGLLSMISMSTTTEKANQMQTNPRVLVVGSKYGSINSRPTTRPSRLDTMQMMRARHSQTTRMKIIVNDAQDMPQSCMRTEKSRAIFGVILNNNVITGKATVPPPTLVDPETE